MPPTNRTVLCLLCAAMFSVSAGSVIRAADADCIRPYSGNPTYWQYQGKPVMLLGGSKTDHIFLLDDLREHLDEIHAVGANYVRNTMSQREGIELKPHKLLSDGKFDLDQWNDDYWQRFQNMLKWTAERDIIVQIEVWDRFDYAEQHWQISPWNPGNNVNYDYQGSQARHNAVIFDDPHHYMFADISQVNSRNFDQTHWDRLQWLLQQVSKHPRPSNHTKIYGSGYYTFGTGGPEDGVERFWRNIIGGSAAARFHRPDAGNGLNDLAKASIRAARLLESRIRFWDITPRMELLSDRAPNEAYLAANPGERYALYFTNGGSVSLDLTDAPGTFDITWISVAMGRIVESSQLGGYRLMDKTIEGGRVVTLSAPYKGGWVAAIVKQ